MKAIRQPVVAGSWYPGDREKLSETIETYYKRIRDLNCRDNVKAIVVPHAGYLYSGEIAASAFKQLRESYNTVFLLGPSHRYPVSGVSIPDYLHYKTPMGEIPLSATASKMKDSEPFIQSVMNAHYQEHSLEIELPFLQFGVSNLEIVPMLVGSIDSMIFSEILEKYLLENDLLVVSVDLSHFHSYERATDLDNDSIDKILDLDDKGILSSEIDAPWAVSALLALAKKKNWFPYLLRYANSGDVSGDFSKVVGYGSFMFLDKELDQQMHTDNRINSLIV